MSTLPLNANGTKRTSVESKQVSQKVLADLREIDRSGATDTANLQRLFGSLADVLGAVACVWWQPSNDGLRWIESRELVVEDTSEDCGLTNDLVACIEKVAENRLPDIFSSDSIPDSPPSANRLAELVTTCHLLALPICKQGRAVAVFSFFEATQDSQWTLEELTDLQHMLETALFESDAKKLFEQSALVQAPTTGISDSGTADSSKDYIGEASRPGAFSDWSKVSNFIDVVGRSLDEVECCYNIANELFVLIGEGRVSVAVRRGSTCRIKAISNQQVFDRRSVIVSAVERLAQQAIKLRQPIWHPEGSAYHPPSLQRQLDAYFEEADTQSIVLLPLMRDHPLSENPDDFSALVRDGDKRNRAMLGVIIIEGIKKPVVKAEVAPAWEIVEAPLTNALANAREHNSLFLMPLWRELGRFFGLFRGHTRNKALAVTALLGILLASLFIVPGEFKLRAEGVIQPRNRARVFAQTPGTIEKLYVVEGQRVEAGQVLLQLSDPQLAAELARVEGKLREPRGKLRTARLQRMRGEYNSSEERQANVIESAGFMASLDKLETQFELLTEKQSQLTIRSPLSGQVFTWDTKRRLQNRPVEAGQKLLTIADSNGPWELELKLSDKRSGYLARVWKQNNQENQESPLTSYVLASVPTQVYSGRVREVSARAQVDETAGNVVRVYVNLDAPPSDSGSTVRPGTEVIAHIQVGDEPIGYCKLYEFFDWINRTWFSYT